MLMLTPPPSSLTGGSLPAMRGEGGSIQRSSHGYNFCVCVCVGYVYILWDHSKFFRFTLQIQFTVMQLCETYIFLQTPAWLSLLLMDEAPLPCCTGLQL